MERLKVGDWVCTPNGRFGYVDEVTSFGSFRVILSCGKVTIFNPEVLEATEEIVLQEDLLAMQLLAVNTNDKAWFSELNERITNSVSASI